MPDPRISCAGLIAILALGACSGGGDAPVVTNYQPFDSTEDATNAIGGFAVLSEDGNLSVQQQSGSYAHETGETIVENVLYTMIDPDGFDGDGVLTDGTVTIRPQDALGYDGDYEFSRAFKDTDGAYNLSGVIGLLTTASDMPQTDVAQFTGEAAAIVVTNTQGFDLNAGTSTVVANFGTNSVDVTLSDFTTIDQFSGLAATGLIDTIVISDMQISGNSFGDGTVATQLDGNDIDIFGTNVRRTVGGSFFGISEDGTVPAEVGGAVLIEGDSGLITGAFIAK